MSETTDTTSPEAEVQPNRPDLEMAPGIPPEDMDDLTEKIVTALKTVFDPEIPVDVYELGLIYRVAVDESRLVDIDMTLTAPACSVPSSSIRKRTRAAASHCHRNHGTPSTPQPITYSHIWTGRS